MEFAVYELTSEGNLRKTGYYCSPNAELFSSNDIYRFSKSFYEETQNCMEASQYTPEPFVKYADSNLLLFGYSKGEYFFEECADQEEYEMRKGLLQKEVKDK